MDKRRGGLSQFFSKVCLTVPKKFVGQHFCVSEKNRVSKKCTHRKGISFSCANNFLSHRVQKFRRGTRLYFRKHRVSKSFMDKRRGVCITIFCQSFCLTKPKVFIGESFCVSEINRVSKNFTHKKGITFFCAINFLSRRVQKFRGGLRLCFKKLWVSKFFLDKRRRGVSQFFVKVFVSQYWKLS